MFMIVFMVKTAQGAAHMFVVDVHELQNVQALVRRRAERAASDKSLDLLSFHKAGFPR